MDEYISSVHCIFLLLLSIMFGNLPVKWPKLLQPFQNFFITFFRCVCVPNVILHHFRYKEVRYFCYVLEQLNAVESCK